MALHPNFPDDPHAILDPAIRWFPADEALRTTSFEKLLPPLVPTLRKEVQAWRDSGYNGATETSQSLLRWWFIEQHLLPKADGTSEEFQYFFAQREALETIVFLYDVIGTIGNIVLTNIHRVYAGNESIPSSDDEDTRDYFLPSRYAATSSQFLVSSVITNRIAFLSSFSCSAYAFRHSITPRFK